MSNVKPGLISPWLILIGGCPLFVGIPHWRERPPTQRAFGLDRKQINPCPGGHPGPTEGRAARRPRPKRWEGERQTEDEMNWFMAGGNRWQLGRMVQNFLLVHDSANLLPGPAKINWLCKARSHCLCRKSNEGESVCEGYKKLVQQLCCSCPKTEFTWTLLACCA